MAVLLHWEPWRVTKELEREIDRLQRWDFGPWTDTFPRWVLPLTEEGRWVPACDLFARGDDLVVRIELPGIDPATDVQVSVQDGILCISGKRKYDAAMEQAEYYRRESAYGAFHRNIPLAQGVEAEDITASYDNGVLEVVITTAAQLREPMRIPVHAGNGKKAVTAGGAKP
jgi:HSP20 family protein